MPKRKKYIDGLLKDSREKLDKLTEIEGNLDFQGETLDEVTLLHTLSNLRTVLDQVAQSIKERFGLKGPSSRKRYFPIVDDMTKLEATLNSNFPNLNTLAPELYSLLTSIQPCVTKSTHLTNLCHLANDYKHNGPPAQSSVRIPEEVSLGVAGFPGRSIVTVQGSAQMSIKGLKVNGRYIASPEETLVINTKTKPEDIAPYLQPGFKLQRQEGSNKFYFTEKNTPVTELLDYGVTTISDFIDRLYENFL